MEEKEFLINDLLKKNASHNSKLQLEDNDVSNVNFSENGTLNGNVSTDSSDSLVELNTLLASQIAQLKKERARFNDDLAAALQTNNELRSQLENAIEEAAALREQRTATDVFSLELKDYEKKKVPQSSNTPRISNEGPTERVTYLAILYIARRRTLPSLCDVCEEEEILKQARSQIEC
ncbi:hypothetical protein KIN20_016116 [Parelaphostrongylus tenuis]|uniref:Uncharacterized protein n=1 Tax=Parelaphostrongylus tenuis TaxID=148309 RepID=A0AAD5N1L1_PARTN|nr:hypothetical protein KIN20_016116 [Parelaphostrongylus tenuis]